MTRALAALLAAFLAGLTILGGCASQGRIDQAKLEADSRRAILAINTALERIERADLTPDEQQDALDAVRVLNEGQLAVDLLAARAAGFELSKAEAGEVQASLSLIYRNIEGIAARPPASLARTGAQLTPEAERMLRDLERLLR